MITDIQAASLSGTWKILLDCDVEIPSISNDISGISMSIWTMVSMEQSLINTNSDLEAEIKEYGMQSHEIGRELEAIKTKLQDLYVQVSLAIQAAKKK